MQAKTFKVVWPEYLSPDLYRHFIRGVTDSDGTISPQTYGIVGTEEFCLRLQEIMEKECDVTGHLSRATYRKVNNIRYFRIGGQLQMKRVLDWLYKDATIYMERKYQKYQDLLRWYPIPVLSKCFNEDGPPMTVEERYQLVVERDIICGQKTRSLEYYTERDLHRKELYREKKNNKTPEQIDEERVVRSAKRIELIKSKEDGTYVPYQSYKKSELYNPPN